jgi:hypothetical protein
MQDKKTKTLLIYESKVKVIVIDLYRESKEGGGTSSFCKYQLKSWYKE